MRAEILSVSFEVFLVLVSILRAEKSTWHTVGTQAMLTE